MTNNYKIIQLYIRELDNYPTHSNYNYNLMQSQTNEGMQPQTMVQAMQQSHTCALMNELIKTQHQLLVMELKKMERLNEQIIEAKQRKMNEHIVTMKRYDEIEYVLQREAQRKDKILKQLKTVGSSKYKCPSQTNTLQTDHVL